MNAVNLYISTCRLVMQADPDNRDTYAELYKLLPYLRQSLTCTVCGRILADPFTPTETSCQHHVCKECIGGKKRLKPSCSWCKDYETYIENSQMQLIIQCYKKLCSYVKATCMYKKLSAIISNGGNCSLTDIIDEAIEDDITDLSVIVPDECRPTSPASCTSSSSSSNATTIESPIPLESYELRRLEDPKADNLAMGIHTSFEPKVELTIKEEDLENHLENLHEYEGKNCISPLLTVDRSAISPLSDSGNINHIEEISNFPVSIFSETPSVCSFSSSFTSSIPQSTTIGSPLPQLSPIPVAAFTSPVLTTSVSTSLDNQNQIVSSDTSVSDVIPITSDRVVMSPVLSSPVSVSKGIMRVNNCKNVSVNNLIPSSIIGINSSDSNNAVHYGLPISSISSSPLYPSASTSNSMKMTASSYSQPSPVINNVSSIEIPSGTLPTASTTAITCVFNVPPGTILSSTNAKHTVRESLIKHGTPLNNGSSMYSVMYSNSESTKITIKRKPPDIENVKNHPLEKEKLSAPQELKKPKPKPKPKPKRKGCRCGNATPTPGKLTCCGQRCPCYVEAKACIECQCRGCRNPHRPGGKKVRPVIPQLGNIQIHQVQPVHPRVSTISGSHNPNIMHPASVGTMSTQTPIMTTGTSGTAPQTIRAVHAMHAVQAVHGLGQIHSVSGGVHQLINIGSGIIDSTLATGLNVNSDLTLKPVNFALSSIPAQLLIHDDKSTSNSTSDNSDIDIDI